MSEPKTFHTKIKMEFIRFLEKPEVSIEEFCIRCNKWRIDNDLPPVEGTPFKMDKKIVRASKLRGKVMTIHGKTILIKGAV